jgi:hypothetical protein
MRLANHKLNIHINQLEMVTYLLQLIAATVALSDPNPLTTFSHTLWNNPPSSPQWLVYTDNATIQSWLATLLVLSKGNSSFASKPPYTITMISKGTLLGSHPPTIHWLTCSPEVSFIHSPHSLMPLSSTRYFMPTHSSQPTPFSS